VATLDLGPVKLRYEVTGNGPPILALAPGGLRASRIETWAAAPFDPISELAARHTVVAMDQRNTGTSFAPITAEDGWHSFAADQVAVMDHLGFDRFGVIGMCIGGAFIVELTTTVPERISAAVAMQPIGRDGNDSEFRAMFDEWRGAHAADHPEATDADWEGCWTNLFGGDARLFSAPDAELSSIATPLLVLQGNDVYHPRSASVELAGAAPAATLIERWKDPAELPAAVAAIHAFFAEHAG
jgi:pimeloyl-ACP methyl ester carboxylesterase